MNALIAAIKPLEVKPWVWRVVKAAGVVTRSMSQEADRLRHTRAPWAKRRGAQDKRQVARNLTCHKLRAPMAHRTASIAIRIINGLPCA